MVCGCGTLRVLHDERFFWRRMGSSFVGTEYLQCGRVDARQICRALKLCSRGSLKSGVPAIRGEIKLTSRHKSFVTRSTGYSRSCTLAYNPVPTLIEKSSLNTRLGQLIAQRRDGGVPLKA
ncbi:hypothetical protein TNCV_3840721 [Trichonephila clavipes]|nr:hypothetical protein TNCV_3840721 [Trichonephila clavipes]